MSGYLCKFTMRILIVVQKYNLHFEADYRYTFPLGLAYIYSAIKRAGYLVDVLNMNHMHGNPADILVEKLASVKYDAIGIGGNAFDYAAISTLIGVAKSHVTKPAIILGGPIITTEPELVYNELQPDYGVIGEGEETIVELIKAIETVSDIGLVKGIIYSGGITKERIGIENLDSIPFPYFEDFEFELKLDNSYNNDNRSSTFNRSRPRIYPILLSRSCPYQCTFCYHVGKYRVRSIKNAMQEISVAVKKYKISALLIYDDTFAVDNGRLVDFCIQMRKLQAEIDWELSWASSLRVATASEGVLSLMRSAGCREIGYGFESYSPVVLKSMRKTVTPEQMDIAIRLTFGQKIAVAGNFIFGDVAETLETANKTLDYWVKNCQSQLNLQLITPYPGSKIYEYCVNKGIIADKLDFIKRGLLIFNSNMTTGISNRDYIKLRARIIGFSQRYFKCVIPKLGEQTGRYRSVVAICPFCGESTSYDYCKITNGAYYSFSVVCRHCYKHFWVASLLHCLVLKYARSLIPYYIIAIKVLRLNLLKKGNLI